MKLYICKFNNSGCRYGGNKIFNYGFYRGLAEYCRYNKEWTYKMLYCPLDKMKEIKKELEG